MAWVDVKIGSGTIPSAGSERCLSPAVAQQVASAITQWTQHLPYLRRGEAAVHEPKAAVGIPVLNTRPPPKIPQLRRILSTAPTTL